VLPSDLLKVWKFASALVAMYAEVRAKYAVTAMYITPVKRGKNMELMIFPMAFEASPMILVAIRSRLAKKRRSTVKTRRRMQAMINRASQSSTVPDC